MTPRTLVEKIWDLHRIADLGAGEDLLFVDRNILHDLTVRIVLPDLERRGHAIRYPHLAYAVPDHAISTAPGRDGATDEQALEFGQRSRLMAERHGLRFFELGSERQGIVHVIGPDLGLTLPGLTVVCTDSHTCTHGALGALAWGVGTSEAAHAMATQTITQIRPRQMRVSLHGRLQRGVAAKDVILALIGRYGAAYGTGHAIEYRGSFIEASTIAQRMTICNMSIEFGAKTGIIAPDETTFSYVTGREFAPKGAQLEAALAHWRGLRSDDDAPFDRELELDVSALAPQVTFGTAVDQSLPVSACIPANAPNGSPLGAALDYMGLKPGEAIEGIPVQWAFIGSCSNGRLEDLEEAARVMRGRKVAQGVKAWVVPGSTAVRRAAEAAGLDRMFIEAGAEWREAGCSLCCAVNGEVVGPGQRCISTSNRNFVGRQGPESRTHLASPATVAASAVTGHIADPRKLLAP